MELIVKDFSTVLRGEQVVGFMSDYNKDYGTLINEMVFNTFFLVYPRKNDALGMLQDEGGIEEIDIWSIRGMHYEVAQALADAGYNKGFKLISQDDYVNNQFK